MQHEGVDDQPEDAQGQNRERESYDLQNQSNRRVDQSDDDRRNESFRVSTLIKLNDRLENLTTVDYIHRNEVPTPSLIEAAPFWGLTLLIAALPLLAYLFLGERAKRAMPKVRDWMFESSWLVNIIVLGIFIVLILAW